MVPVTVKVELEGYETLEFDWVSEEVGPDRVMVPSR